MSITALKFDRNYIFTCETVDGTTLTIKPPFTLEFDITRQTFSSANTAKIRLYNLAEVNRNQMQFNSYNPIDFRLVELRAGYGDNLPVIFTGNITTGYSVREGVNFITQLECYDGGFAFVNGTVNISFPAGTPYAIVIATLMQQLPHTSVGAVGNFPGVLTKGNTYQGNPAQILYEITGGAFFIDNGKSYALKTSEYLQTIDLIHIINADTGLLNTPILEENYIKFELLFDPSLVIGTLIQVLSITYPSLNGLYIIKSIKHKGTISRAVSGNATTTVEVLSTKEKTPVLGSPL